MNYPRLTKRIIEKNDNEQPKEKAVCAFYGTEKCQQIHSSRDCSSCPMFQNFIDVLATFEDIYTDMLND